MNIEWRIETTLPSGHVSLRAETAFYRLFIYEWPETVSWYVMDLAGERDIARGKTDTIEDAQQAVAAWLATEGYL